MNTKVVNNKLTCLNHNEEVKFIVLEESVPFAERFLCTKCFDAYPEGNKIMPITKIPKDGTIIKSKNPPQFNNKQDKKKKLEKACSNIKNLKLTYQNFLDFMDFEFDYSNFKLTMQMDNQSVSKVILVQEVKQLNKSYALAFNPSGTLMVSGCDSNIIVWNFNGELTQSSSLSGHTDSVYCLVFSKKINWFASGGKDCKILSWGDDDDWTSYDNGKLHSGPVYSLILNQEENQLFSCSQDKSIVVWKVICKLNLILFDYSLEKKHTDEILSISLNESETTLASCSRDKQIIIWYSNNGIWSYQNHIINDDFGQRLCFIDNNIIVQLASKEISQVYSIVDGQLKPEFHVQLREGTQDDYLFPTIYNKEKKIIIQKYANYVYVLRKQENGKFNFLDPIDCFTHSTYGTLTNDGQYLVIWNSYSKVYRVYNIQYK